VRPGNRSDPSFVPRLAGFIRFLRLRGFAVGTGSALDCAQALRHISILDRETFLAACIVTLAKSPEDVPRLIESFDLFWSTYIEPADSKTRLAVSAPPSPPPDGRVSATETETAPGFRIAVDRTGVVRVGLYSPDAPSSSHDLRPLDQRRVVAIRAGVRRFRRHAATRPGRRQRRLDEVRSIFPRPPDTASDKEVNGSSSDSGSPGSAGRNSSSYGM